MTIRPLIAFAVILIVFYGSIYVRKRVKEWLALHPLKDPPDPPLLPCGFEPLPVPPHVDENRLTLSRHREDGQSHLCAVGCGRHVEDGDWAYSVSGLPRAACICQACVADGATQTSICSEYPDYYSKFS